MSDKKAQIDVMSTKLQIKDFLENNLVWKDIQNELAIWLDGFKAEKGNIVDDAAESNPSTASVLLHLGDLNGREKAIRYTLTLPHLFLNLLSDKEEEEDTNPSNDGLED